MIFFDFKKSRKDKDKAFKDKLAEVDERQSKVDKKLRIENRKTELLNELIDRSIAEDNVTLKLFLVMGGDRKIQK